MKFRDKYGDILRKFYSMYGRPQEGPPETVNIPKLISDIESPKKDFISLQQMCENAKVHSEFLNCYDLLEKVASCLADSANFFEELDGVVSKIGLNDAHLSHGIFWYTLATKLDPRSDSNEVGDLKLPDEIPFHWRYMLQVQGALVFRLYIALVYMREGVIQDIMQKGSLEKRPTLVLCRKLINCDYVRHLRNALSHADFTPSVAGIIFRDKGVLYGGTPGFLDWLCIWIFTIHHITLLIISKNQQPTNGFNGPPVK